MIKIRNINKDKLDYVYVFNKLNTSNNIIVSLYNELIRSNIIKELTALMISKLHNLKIPNFYKLKKYNKLDELVHKWCWDQYPNKLCKDVVIPYIEDNNYNYAFFIEDINYITDNTMVNMEYINDLVISVSIFLKKKYLLFLKLTESQIDVKYNLTEYDDYIDVIIYNNINGLNAINKEITFIISKELFNRLHNKLKKFSKIKKDYYNIYILCLIYRYSYIDSNNQQLAINYNVKKIFKEYGVNFELYGSAINVLNDYYCSLFYDIEQFFGSRGNFFDIKLTHGIYWCNPPYINDIMTRTAEKLIYFLEKNKNLAFIITIPLWDKNTQEKKINNITMDYNKNESRDLFKDYPIYYILKPYIKIELIIPKNTIPYFNYRLNKPVYAVDTYMLLVYKEIDKIYCKYLSDSFNKILLNKYD